MSKVKVVVEVDSCDKDETAAVDPNIVSDIFYMTFGASKPIKNKADEKSIWYLNPGNISEESFITFNPMPWAAKLTQIKITMTPAFDVGEANWVVMKNSGSVSGSELIIPAGQSKGGQYLDIDFTIDDYIGLGLTLGGVTTETWPAAVLVFQRG